MKTKVIIASLVASVPLASHAATINIDFGRTISTGNINNVATADVTAGNTDSIPDLIDDTGSATGFSFTFATDDGLGGDDNNVGTYDNTIGNAHTGPYAASVTSLLGITDSAILGDGINVINVNDPLLTLGGLDSSFTYELRIYNARGAGTTGAWDYATTDGTGTYNLSDDSILDNDDVIVFSGLTPDINGEISTVLSKNGNARGGINFLQVVTTPVPEPSAALLLGLGALIATGRRRRGA
ncbi:MAG: PEP-CTERM sorting domain-containing protein [Verrucomicrobiota bacterium JB023]|nr:PEP-CTERM sorting domain-containing protein [Verrucomicrobiota bacterium JB023]